MKSKKITRSAKRGTDELFLQLTKISGDALLKLLGLSDDEAKQYKFRSIVLKTKRLEPDIEAIPLLPGHKPIYIEFQGYMDPFIRYKLVSKALLGCANENYSGDALAYIIYTDEKYKIAANDIDVLEIKNSVSITEIVLTDYAEEQLLLIDPRLVVLAPFTVKKQSELAEKSRVWKSEIEKHYEVDLKKQAQDLIALFILNRFKNLSREEVVAMLNFDLMDTKAGKQIFEEGMEKGMEKGMLNEAQEMVMEAIEAKYGNISQDIAEKIKAINYRDILKKLLKYAIRCKDIDEFTDVLAQYAQ
ncbi:MAG: DUF2887 domain-containing protein [Desulfobacterales bacterium]|nr:DUF2887 domain-containing protein [Desulfobacterales bacterium]